MGSDDFGMGYRAGEVVAFWDYFRPYALTRGGGELVGVPQAHRLVTCGST